MISPGTMQALLDFRKERDWEQFHTPKNLAVALIVEAGELLEQFQWTKDDRVPADGAAVQAIRQELADVTIVLSYLAHDLGIDLDQAVHAKMAINAERYPVATSRGTARKHSEAATPKSSLSEATETEGQGA